MTDEKDQIDSLEDAMRHFIEMHKPNVVKHIENFMGMAKHGSYPGRVGVLMKKYLMNQFGFDDNRYYYLIHRKGWWNNWAETDNANVTKYHHKPGCGISSRIYSNMQMNKKFASLGALAISFPDNSWHYIKCNDFIKFATKYDTIFDSRFGQVDVGLAAEVTTVEDPLKIDV